MIRQRSTHAASAEDGASADALWGVGAIARYVGRSKRQTYYLLARGALPHRKLGLRTIVASKRELDAALGREGGA